LYTRPAMRDRKDIAVPVQFILPREVIWGCIYAGAKLSKDGQECKKAVLVEEHAILKGLEKFKTASDLLADGRFFDRRRVRLGGKTGIMRTRPIFAGWSCEVAVTYEPEKANQEDVARWMSEAGAWVGIGDYRPTYGRFEVGVVGWIATCILWISMRWRKAT